MNRFTHQASYHGRAIGAILSVGVAALGMYSAGIVFYVNDRWRNGTSRVYDPPNWDNIPVVHKQKVVRSRQSMVEAIRDLYQMKQGITNEPATISFFSSGCVVEDPFYRFVGTKEILRAFGNLHRKNKYITFKVFEPTHYEKAIIIKCEREFENVTVKFLDNNDPQLITSNLAIHLIVDEAGEEKINYIVDEWNYVSLVQPETHNAFIFAGSVARMLRRISSITAHIYLEENKSLFNPVRLLESAADCLTYASRKFFGKEERVIEKPKSETEVVHVQSFDAGVKKS